LPQNTPYEDICILIMRYIWNSFAYAANFMFWAENIPLALLGAKIIITIRALTINDTSCIFLAV
jgi:hypothetical protein